MRKGRAGFGFVSRGQPNTLHCGGPTLRSRSVRAFELESGREFCSWQVLTVPLKLQQNKEIPTPASWLSTEAGICVFPPVSALLSSQVRDLLLLNLSWPGWAEDRAVGSQSSLLGILVSAVAFLAVSFLWGPSPPLGEAPNTSSVISCGLGQPWTQLSTHEIRLPHTVCSLHRPLTHPSSFLC